MKMKKMIIAAMIATASQAQMHDFTQDYDKDLCKISIQQTKQMLRAINIAYAGKDIDGGRGVCYYTPQASMDAANVSIYCDPNEPIEITEEIKALEKIWSICDVKGFLNYDTAYSRERETAMYQLGI